MKWAVSILIFCVAVLIGLGMVMLYSSSMNMEIELNKPRRGAEAAAAPAVNAGMNMETEKSAVGTHYLMSQFQWFIFGLICCVIAAGMDYRRLKRLSPWLLGLSVVLLILVFVPFLGHPIKGAHRWIWRPGLPHFQSSELAKLALILFLAAYGDRYQRQMTSLKKGLLIPGAIIGVVLALIFIEPDRGCAILLAAVCGVMMIVAGVRLSSLIPPVALLIGGLVFSFMHDPMRLGRIMAWAHPEQNKSGAGYQAYEAIIALGSGGWSGLGLGNGRQKLGFVPEHHTDFIFSIIGEELGLVATMAVVLLFIALVVCGVFIARRSSDARFQAYQKLLARVAERQQSKEITLNLSKRLEQAHTDRELDNLQKDALADEETGGDPKLADKQPDLVLHEAERVLVDLIPFWSQAAP